MFSSPSTPPIVVRQTVTPAPEEPAEELTASERDELLAKQKRLAAMRSTIATSPMGVTEQANTARKTVLGA